MSFTVIRKPDRIDPDWDDWRGWDGTKSLEAEAWANKYCPGSLISNDFSEFHFNNKDAAIMFKMVWG